MQTNHRKFKQNQIVHQSSDHMNHVIINLPSNFASLPTAGKGREYSKQHRPLVEQQTWQTESLQQSRKKFNLMNIISPCQTKKKIK